MRKSLFQVAGVLALLSAGEAQAAKAKQCLTRAEVHGMVGYFLPTVLDTAIKNCGAQLPASSFLLARAPRVVGELTPGRAAAWPMARQAFAKFAGNDGDELANMPDDIVQPVVDEALAGIVGQEIKAKNCKDIDRIMAPLSPLPAANMVDLIAEIFMVAARNDKEMPTCRDS